MRNCLAAFGACIDNETEAFFSNSKFFCYFRQDFLYMSHQFHRRRNDIFRVFLGNDEDMDWCYGTKVIDGNDFIIFIDAGALSLDGRRLSASPSSLTVSRVRQGRHHQKGRLRQRS